MDLQVRAEVSSDLRYWSTTIGTSMHRILLIYLALAGSFALVTGCASQRAARSHSINNPVHVVSTAPPTCPVCALYTINREHVVRLRTLDGQGAGVVINRGGDILTSAHIVADATDVRVDTNDGQEFAAVVTLADTTVDLAVVHVESTGMAWSPIDSAVDEDLPIGSKVYVIGHPMGMGWTVTQGIVSGHRIAGEVAGTELIQTDAAISPGNSGGPLIDEHGHLVGIVRSKLVGPGIESVAFAVPMSAVVEFLNRPPLQIPFETTRVPRTPDSMPGETN